MTAKGESLKSLGFDDVGFTMRACEEQSCPYCYAPAGQWCTDTRTGDVTRSLHPSRLRAQGFHEVGEQDSFGEEDGTRWDRDE